MKVLFLVSGLGLGGAEKVVSLLASAWAERGWTVMVAAFDAPGDPVAHTFADGIELIRLDIPPGGGPLLRGFRSSVRRLLALRRLLHEQRPDVAISFLTKVNVLALLAGAGTGIPMIISERNNPGEQSAHPFWAWAWKGLASSATAVVLQTEAIRRHYPKKIAEKAVVIPNAVAIPLAGSRTMAGPVVAAVGRLTPQKGFDLLIPVFAELSESFPEWRLVIFGEGPERSCLESMVACMGLSERILLPGNSISPGSWIAESDVFVLPSRFEGFPNVLVEAMMGGLPTVSFACNFGPADIITDGHDGILVPAQDTRTLAEALRKILSDHELRRLIAANAKVSAERFRTARVVSSWDSLVLRSLGVVAVDQGLHLEAAQVDASAELTNRVTPA